MESKAGDVRFAFERERGRAFVCVYIKKEKLGLAFMKRKDLSLFFRFKIISFSPSN